MGEIVRQAMEDGFNPAENRKPDRASRIIARPVGAGETARETERLWKQTISGRAFPLVGFTALDIDLFGDMAEGLARICRYGGHVPGNVFSVAQHCVLGADAAMEETGDATLAAYFLLHDGHEYIVGDITTPVAGWLNWMANELFGRDDIVRTLIAAAKGKLDQAIWRAAGMPPPGRTYRAAVADYDCRMLAAEKRQILMPEPKSWGQAVDRAKPIRMRGKITAWPVARAADEYRARLETLCPNAMRI